jgi:hypothetical protein
MLKKIWVKGGGGGFICHKIMTLEISPKGKGGLNREGSVK